ncbi:uncharacterized protein LOC123261374 [Cotesia glomerata]|uniref:uncharacterized protein LOC123261374 n=1 Tax=Cotesia glomerata TaxID=32391 RepID=UPI001D02E223|nr:uncharacterized protein LOC123261374 [Cotesia glomerata]
MDSNQLSPDWSSLSTDDKLTLVMKSVAQLPVLTTEFKTLSSKIDDLGSRLNMLQIEQSNTKEALNSINSNVNSNTTNIIQLRNELETIKEDTLKNSKSLADQHALISSVATSNDSSGVLPNYQVTSELVISGIPDSVVQGSSAIEITSSVFKALKVPELKTDILSSRLIEKRAKSFSNIVKDNAKPILHSIIVKLKSPKIRDYIIESKRKLKTLLIKTVFPETANVSKGFLYVNEFLNAEIHKLLLITKSKAKTLRFKYVWVQNGLIFVKKDGNTAKIKICSEADLIKLD